MVVYVHMKPYSQVYNSLNSSEPDFFISLVSVACSGQYKWKANLHEWSHDCSDDHHSLLVKFVMIGSNWQYLNPSTVLLPEFCILRNFKNAERTVLVNTCVPIFHLYWLVVYILPHLLILLCMYIIFLKHIKIWGVIKKIRCIFKWKNFLQ